MGSSSLELSLILLMVFVLFLGFRVSGVSIFQRHCTDGCTYDLAVSSRYELTPCLYLLQLNQAKRKTASKGTWSLKKREFGIPFPSAVHSSRVGV